MESNDINLSGFLALPMELKELIFSYLSNDSKALLAVRRVCSEWHELSSRFPVCADWFADLRSNRHRDQSAIDNSVLGTGLIREKPFLKLAKLFPKAIYWNLEKMYFRSADSIIALRSLTSLTSLNLHGAFFLTESDIHVLTALRRLRALDLSYIQFPVQPAGQPAIKLHLPPSIRKLTLDGVGARNRINLSGLLTLTKLTSIGLARAQLSPSNMEVLARYSSLRKLRLFNAQLPPNAINVIARLPLSQLYLENHPLSQHDLTTISRNLSSNLKVLAVSLFNDVDVQPLSCLKSVKHLSLAATLKELRPEDVLHLAALPELEQLILRRFKILSHSFHLPENHNQSITPFAKRKKHAEEHEEKEQGEAAEEMRLVCSANPISSSKGVLFPRLARLNFIRCDGVNAEVFAKARAILPSHARVDAREFNRPRQRLPQIIASPLIVD